MLNNIEEINNSDNNKMFDLIFEIINLTSLSDENQAKNLIDLLTNHPSPIREAAAYKVEELISVYPQFFKNEFSKNKLTNAICDINPNVSRILCNIISNNDFISELLIEKIIEKISDLSEKIKEYEQKNKDFFENKIKNKKNHAKNKILFAMYWYLEALSCCRFKSYENEILKIINYTINFSDYTIREKSAKLLAGIENPPCEILQKAKNDQNFYVKIQLYDKMTLKI